ncbi:MAG: HD domain-containing protein [Methanolinea sp.]|nr:HD domain-containing protein [Methanolinea sp.]
MERDALSAIHLAAGIAARAHAGQARKDGITPYIVHPARVATLAARFGGDHVAIVSAWLHDVFEDCAPGACAAARKEIGALPLPEGEARAVMAIVEALTKDPSLPKEVQIPDSLDRILAAPPQAVLVKLCDRIDNLLDAELRGGGFKEAYFRKSHLVLERLRDAGVRHGYGGAVAVMEALLGE